MQELRLVAVSEDGTYLVLATAGRGTRFTLPVDDRLRAAVRGNFSRLGQYEIEVESPLRPKEIQARIRAGETAEEIAATAGIPVERVRWFEGPVLQEREYMAQQAQRVPVRLPGETTPGPTLGELVAERLTRRGVPADEIDWDSCKRDDNLWRVKLGFVWNGHTRHAEWLFDPRRRHITPNDEEAMRLSAADYVDPVPEEDTTVRPLMPRLASKLTPVPPLPDEPDRREPAGRVQPEFTVPTARPEPLRETALRETPRGSRGDRGEPHEPAPFRPGLTPVPFRLPDPLALPGDDDLGAPARLGGGTRPADVREAAGQAGPAQNAPGASSGAPVAVPGSDSVSGPDADAPAAQADDAVERPAAEPAVPARNEPDVRPTVPAARPASDDAAPAAAVRAAQNAPASAPQPEKAEPAAGAATAPAAEAPKESKPEVSAPPVPKPAPPRPRKGRRRASVPTWDEIMFGTRKQE